MKIKATGLDLEIRVISPPPPIPEDKYDDWMKCLAKIKVPGFSGEFEFEIELADFQRFYSELRNMASQLGALCSASLCGVEPGIDLKITMNPRGQISGKYEFENYSALPVSTVLSGAFEMDQTFLEPLSKQVKEIIEKAG